MYPRIIIKENQILENSRHMVKHCQENGITYVMGIVKVFAGQMDIIEDLAQTGWSHIGDSRIENLKKMKDIPLPKVLVRLPMISEVDDVIAYTDVSLNSEIKTIRHLNLKAKSKQKKHQIILMFDLGDLREGLFYKDDYNQTIKEILEMKHIELIGIGTNLTCYGGLVPSPEILGRLVHIKNQIESAFQIQLKIISGGNSSTVTLFDQNKIPKDINSLRLGESIIFGKETSYSTDIKGYYHDNFLFQAEIIECQMKPSFPDGPTTINSFGEKVNIEDKGMMKRAILAVGKQDVLFENLNPVDEQVHIIGGSSDHLILDVTGQDYQVGDIVSFHINYPGLLHLMNSSYIKKVIQKK